ncbi:ATP-grasp peptide maturase system methyltransferase [Streptomyces sp. NPDC005813]|uniref:ATP-grasp peptide maturase system methyltransferase n=1 Tax=Streptomyces sp. NPDC005813 TaxID=3155592 RepID=UPI003410C795
MDHAQLRERLVEKLTANGSLRTRAWRSAAETVPRHEFLHGGFFRHLQGPASDAWTPVLDSDADWLEACYQDESLVTQIAGTILPTDVRGQIMRAPTSSSTMPSLVLRMLEDLHVEPESNVLEIGTGSGYSTALLCARLGDERVTSIEYDDTLASRARTALARQSMFPAIVTANGLDGHPESAPYDRVIATCGIRTVPTAWIEQTRPGGLILATISGWLNSSELARLTVHGDGTASGPLLGGQVSFMLARPHTPPALGLLPDLNEGTERETLTGGEILADWTTRFVVQLAAPHAQRLTIERDGHTEDVLIDIASGSWATVHKNDGRWIVRQSGPEALWDTVEEQLGRWHAAGTPPLEKFTVTVTPDGQTIHCIG